MKRYDILDTPPDGAFDRITRIAARVFEVPIAIVSIVDEGRIWIKSHHGLHVEEIPRQSGLCASAILDNKPWMLNDAKHDPRSLANPLVAGEFGLRFYAVVPLHTRDGFNLGTLCVIDHQPRPASETDVEQLRDLAAVVMDELELRLEAKREIAKKEALLKSITGSRTTCRSSRVSCRSRAEPCLLRCESHSRSLQRIEAVGRLHEKFYRGTHSETVDLTDYIAELLHAVISTYGLEARVKGRVEGPPVHFSLDTGTPLALLAAQVIANACKHAFPSDRAGEIVVEVHRTDNELRIRLAMTRLGRSRPALRAPVAGSESG